MSNNSSASIGGFIVVAALTVGSALRTIITRSFDTPVAALLPEDALSNGRVTFDTAGGGPLAYFAAGYTIQFLSILAAALLLVFAARSYRTSGGFNATASRFTLGAFAAMFTWGIGRFIISMGNNFLASRFEVYEQWHNAGNDNSVTLLWLFILYALILVHFLLKRGTVLQREQEDLV